MVQAGERSNGDPRKVAKPENSQVISQFIGKKENVLLFWGVPSSRIPKTLLLG